MSWKETCPMTERMHFVSDLLKDERSMTELCRIYGISRTSGYKWRDRFDSGGLAALADRAGRCARANGRCSPAHGSQTAAAQPL